MVDLVLDTDTVRGRVLHESDSSIRIESLGRGTIGYAKSKVGEIRRFSLSELEYYEELGDIYHERAWDFEDGATLFVKARQSYLRALNQNPDTEDESRIERKLQFLGEDRAAWQEEILRREELKKAQKEVELLELQKQAAAEQLEMGRRNLEEIRELQRVVTELTDRFERMGDFLTLVDEKIEDLEDDVDRVGRIFIRVPVFDDLKRSHDSLVRDFRRLERKVETP